MNKIGIYKITNPKGKIYIGQSINIEKRFNEYRTIKNIRKQRLIYNSLCKYSSELHTFEIVEECELESLNERERYWQDHYDVLNNGMNLKLTSTNDKTGRNSIETNKKISNTLLGHEVSDKCKKISSIVNKGNKYCLGYKHTKEFLDSLKKPILQYTIDDVFIKEWDSLKSAAMELTSKNNNLKSKTGSISNCLNGIAKTGLGYKWKYKL